MEQYEYFMAKVQYDNLRFILEMEFIQLTQQLWNKKKESQS